MHNAHFLVEGRTCSNFQSRLTFSITGQTNSLRSLGAYIWNELPDEIKNIFTRMSKEWDGPNCKCNVCKYEGIDSPPVNMICKYTKIHFWCKECFADHFLWCIFVDRCRLVFLVHFVNRKAEIFMQWM